MEYIRPGIFSSRRLYNTRNNRNTKILRTFYAFYTDLYELIKIFHDIRNSEERHESSFNNEYLTHFQLILKENTETDLLKCRTALADQNKE